MKPGSVLLALLLASAPLGAQTPGAVVPPAATEQAAAAAEPTAGCEEYAPGDFITPHITDAHCLEVPGFPRFWEPQEVVLPRWAPIHVGGVVIDMSPTKHVVMLLIAALLCCVVLIGGGR